MHTPIHVHAACVDTCATSQQHRRSPLFPLAGAHTCTPAVFIATKVLALEQAISSAGRERLAVEAQVEQLRLQLGQVKVRLCAKGGVARGLS